MRANRSSLIVFLLCAGAASPASLDLVSVVKAHFKSWDKDQNGFLTPDEIDALTLDANVKGDEAAAVATIKVAMRRKVDAIKNIPFFEVDRLNPGVKTFGPEQSDEPDFADGIINLQRVYRVLLGRIRSTNRTVFAVENPDLTHIIQGALGDCYFVSMLGALAHNHPQQIRSMISMNKDGSCDVTFPGQNALTVKRLTDTEIGISSIDGKDGIWVPIIEHAYGQLRGQSYSANSGFDEATDAIASGGSCAGSIRALTGHSTARINLTLDPTKPLSDGDVKDRLQQLRAILPQIIAVKRLAGLGTAKSGLPPGITINHVFALLSYDSEKDAVTLWNPHGNRFVPKGTPGMQNGWPTTGGKFTMALADMTRVFVTIIYETVPSPRYSPSPRLGKITP